MWFWGACFSSSLLLSSLELSDTNVYEPYKLGRAPGAVAVAPLERRNDPISLHMAYCRVRWIIHVWIIHKIPAGSAVWQDEMWKTHPHVVLGGVPGIKNKKQKGFMKYAGCISRSVLGECQA